MYSTYGYAGYVILVEKAEESRHGLYEKYIKSMRAMTKLFLFLNRSEKNDTQNH